MKINGSAAVKLISIFVVILGVILVLSMFIPINKTRGKSVALSLMKKCPGEAVSVTTMLADGKMTYFEYFKFEAACSKDQMERKSEQLGDTLKKLQEKYN